MNIAAQPFWKGVNMIRQIFDTEVKQAVAREILEALPEWFGIP